MSILSWWQHLSFSQSAALIGIILLCVGIGGWIGAVRRTQRGAVFNRESQ